MYKYDEETFEFYIIGLHLFCTANIVEKYINPSTALTAKINILNVHTLEVVSRYLDPQF